MGTQEYLFAVIVFAATAVISGVGVLVYRKITQHHQKKEALRQAREEASARDGEEAGKPAV